MARKRSDAGSRRSAWVWITCAAGDNCVHATDGQPRRVERPSWAIRETNFCSRECYQAVGASMVAAERMATGRGWGRQRSATTERVETPDGPKSVHVTPDGYRVIHWPQHPNANRAGKVLEHQWVMADKIGRPLLPGENVHHLNGVRHDNRPENLELWVTSQPSGQRPEQIVAWAKEMLARYEPSALAE